jgi:hypothetical protein
MPEDAKSNPDIVDGFANEWKEADQIRSDDSLTSSQIPLPLSRGSVDPDGSQDDSL